MKKIAYNISTKSICGLSELAQMTLIPEMEQYGASQCAKHCLLKNASQCAAKKHCLTTTLGRGLFQCGFTMIEKGLYYIKREFGDVVRSIGGEWNDEKHRPIVCLIKSSENDNLYWAIPMGKLNHRDQNQKDRLNFYLSLPDGDIRSCYYHIGRTTTKSIFFISDAIPIIDEFIDTVHVGADNNHFIIKNPNLVAELQRKLFRILSYENSNKNSFRQHITGIKEVLLEQLNNKTTAKDLP